MKKNIKFQSNVTFLKRPYDLFPLIMVNIKEGIFHGLRLQKSYPEFPKTIGTYNFHATFKKEGLRKSYQLGMYRSKSGKRAIAKMIGKKIKGYHYYSLLNEILMYEILFKARKRVQAKLPKNLSHIIIPELLDVVETDEYLVALIEFVEGVPAEKKSIKERVAIYFSVVNFLEFLGAHMTKSEKMYISKRTGYNYILLYPLLVAKAIITYPGSTLSVIKGIPIFLAALPKLLQTPWTHLSHRDLHFLNILVSNHTIALIDLQQCVFTNKYHEHVTSLKEVWHHGSLHKLLLKEILTRYTNEKDFLQLFKAFSVNTATHALTGSGFPKKTIKSWINFLNFCIRLQENNIKKFI